MKSLALLIAWLVLFVVAWPLALVVLVLAPVLWLILLPLRLVGIFFDAALALIKAILFLPARLFGYRG